MIYTSIVRALMAQFSTFMKSAIDVFAQKKIPKDIFNSKFVIDTIN